jgi:hypothetical protein
VSLPKVSRYTDLTTAVAAMEAAVVVAWRHPSPIRFGFMAMHDTLFRVIALGTGSLSPGDAFQKQGFVRKGSEHVVGPMPPFGETLKTDDDLWKIIAWIRSVHGKRRPEGC